MSDSTRKKIDGIRERLNMKDLPESEKKNLFQKFVQAGGQVVDLDERERKSLQKALQTLEKSRPPELKDEQAFSPKEPLVKKQQDPNPVSQWIDLAASRITCALLGIIRWNGRQMREGFVNFLIYDFQNTLLQIKMILASLLYQDKAITAEISQVMLADSSSPFGYELIYRLDNLYKEEYFRYISEHKMESDSLFQAMDVLKAMYRSLFVIQNYQVSLKMAIEKALTKEGSIRRLSARITDQNIKSLHAAIDFIYERVINRLYPLMEYAYRQQRQKKRLLFRDFLGMTPEDALGHYTDEWQKEMQKNIQQEAEKQKASSSSLFPQSEEAAKNILQGLSEYVQSGVSFINERIPWKERLLEFESNRHPRAVYTSNDKIFLVETIVELYDYEFSFLFTTHKVQYNYLMVDGKRIDVKKELLDLYYKMMPMRDRFNEYLRILREIRAVEKETFLSIAEKSSRLNQLAIQRSQVSRQIRKDLRELFEQFSAKWLFILSHGAHDSPIIQNGTDALSFDKKLDGERWAHGKTINDAIKMAYSLTDTIHFLLMGELGGTSILIEKSFYLKI